MAPIRQIAHRQLELLVEFAETNPAIALNKHSCGPLGHQHSLTAWENIARMLNAVGDGYTNTAEKWKRYWHMYKCRTKTKAADNRRNAGGTGGGPSKLCPLTDLELRVVALIGNVAVEGAPVSIALNLYDEQCQQIELPFQELEEPPRQPAAAIISADSATNTAAVISADSAATNAATVISADSATNAAAVHSTAAAASATTAAAAINASPLPRINRANHDDNVPRWVYNLEERRLAVEEGMVDAVAAIGRSLSEMAAAQERSAAAQERCVELLLLLIQQQPSSL